MTDLGFKGSLLLQMELPNYSVGEIATMFFDKAYAKGYVFDTHVTADFVINLIQNDFSEEWRAARNGRVAELLLHAVRAEIKNRLKANEDASPIKTKRLGSTASPVSEEITITIQDVKSALSAV